MSYPKLKEHLGAELVGVARAHDIPEKAITRLVANLESCLDQVLEEVEKAVVPKCKNDMCNGSGTVYDRDHEGDVIPSPCEFCHRERLHLTEALAQFRGEGGEKDWVGRPYHGDIIPRL